MARRLTGALAAAMAATLLAVAASRSFCQEPLVLRFDIEGYRVEGNSLLRQSEVERVLAPFQGKQRDFGDVQRALEALESAYRKAGYSAVQVYLPEQELKAGVVMLQVVEAKLASIKVSGNNHFDPRNIRRSLPALKEGTTPSAPRIADNTQLANENPAKKVRVVLRPAGRPNEVDANVEVEDEKPWRVFVLGDNTGTNATGRYRTGVGLQHSNLFNRDHVATAQYITSPEKSDQVSIYSIGYRVPVYSLGDSVDLFAGYSDVNAGVTETVAGPLQFAGRGQVAGARYNWLLPRRGEYEHRVVFGVDYRIFDNACSVGAFGAAGCGAAGADVTVHPAGLSYLGQWNSRRGQTAFYATVLRNIPGGRDGSEADLQASRPNAKGDYIILRYGASMALGLWHDFQLRLRLDSQYTEDALVQGEQFGIGGWNSVRGFLEREIANDRGYSGSVEFYTPDIAQAVELKSANLRFLVFYDQGHVRRVDPVPGDTVTESIAGAGGGLRLGFGKSVALRADVATVINAGGSQQKGEVRGHFGFLLSF